MKGKSHGHMWRQNCSIFQPSEAPSHLLVTTSSIPLILPAQGQKIVLRLGRMPNGRSQGIESVPCSKRPCQKPFFVLPMGNPKANGVTSLTPQMNCIPTSDLSHPPNQRNMRSQGSLIGAFDHTGDGIQSHVRLFVYLP